FFVPLLRCFRIAEKGQSPEHWPFLFPATMLPLPPTDVLPLHLRSPPIALLLTEAATPMPLLLLTVTSLLTTSHCNLQTRFSFHSNLPPTATHSKSQPVEGLLLAFTLPPITTTSGV